MCVRVRLRVCTSSIYVRVCAFNGDGDACACVRFVGVLSAFCVSCVITCDGLVLGRPFDSVELVVQETQQRD